MARPTSWIGVDLDRTLHVYDGKFSHELGEPIPEMLERVKKWIADGKCVKIMTARVSSFHGPDEIALAVKSISKWTLKHVGVILDVTSEKDPGMIELWDDSCVRVERNTGRRLSPSFVEID